MAYRRMRIGEGNWLVDDEGKLIGMVTTGGEEVLWPIYALDASNNVTGLVGPDGVYAVIKADTVEASIQNLTAVVGAAGDLTGAYYYTLTFVTAQGETDPWPGTPTAVNPSSQQVNLSAIPLGADGTLARRIYRTPATPTDLRDYRFLVEIADNTTTTYVDNIVDGSLGDPVNWIATNSGTLTINGETVAAVSGQSTQFGRGAFAANAGYASVAIGLDALADNTTGRRNVAIGAYALGDLTTGYTNVAIGVHAGNGCVASIGNTLVGYAVGGTTSGMTNYNTVVGFEAFIGSGATKGGTNTAVGRAALQNINTADSCIGIGPYAGKYANASRQVFFDNLDRTNISGCQNIGLIYGKGETTAIAQVLHLNAPTRIGPPSVTVATLPAAAAGYAGFRAFVTDANATTFASIVAGGGSNGVPVYCDGTNWRIG